MLFSCKITSSILSFLESKGEDSTFLLESTPMPEEFLKDASCWLNAKDMESFLTAALTHYKFSLQQMAYATPVLRSWGVFDSVLRMMSFADVLAQPSRFFSYFISPEPPIENLVRTENSITLDLPIPAEKFPHTVEYLKSSFEVLPLFSGQPQASCSWVGFRIKIEWETNQKSIFNNEELGHQISPELMRSIVAQLEKHQLELQQKNAELEERNEQLKKAYQDLEFDLRQKLTLQQSADPVAPSLDKIETGSLEVLRDQITKLSDYMVRAQQLITLLIGMDRLNPGILKAMHRVDWELVKKQYPEAIARCLDIVQRSVEVKNEKRQSVNSEGDLHV